MLELLSYMYKYSFFLHRLNKSKEHELNFSLFASEFLAFHFLRVPWASPHQTLILAPFNVILPVKHLL